MPFTVLRRHSVAVALALVAGGTALAADPVVVQLEARAHVAGGVVRLGDVAHLGSGARPALAWLSLGRTPDAGSKRTIEASEIQNALAAAGFAPGAVTLKGAPRVTVESESVALAGAALVELARKYAQRELASSGDEITLETVAPLAPGEVAVPMGRESSALRPRWSAGAPSSAATTAVVAVDVVIDGEVRATIEQGFHLKRFVTCLVATHNFAKGDSLDGHAFELGRVERGSVSDECVIDRDDVQGATARREIKTGAALTRSALSVPLLIKRGDHVQVAILKGSLRVTGEGTALKDAGRGETLTVQTHSGKDPLSGRAVSEGHVEVTLETSAIATSADASSGVAAVSSHTNPSATTGRLHQ